MSGRAPILSADRVGPFVAWAALAAFVVWAARGLDLGSFAKPGPALFPVLLSVAIGLLAVVDLVLPGPRQAQDSTQEPGDLASLRLQRALVILCVVLFAVLLPYLGTVLVSVLMMMFLLVAVEKQPLLKSLAISLGTSLIMYAVLAIAFGVPLPNGPLEVLF